MSQASRGFYSWLYLPFIYELVQTLSGQKRLRRWLQAEVLDFPQGTRVLDLGCGTGSFSTWLGDVEYVGIDNNPAYIEQARVTYGSPTRQFVCVGVEKAGDLGVFDRCVSIGVLHHLQDEDCRAMFALAASVLKPDPSAEMITIDPCYFQGQSWLARFMTSLDRGKSVRTPEGYEALAAPYFSRRRIRLKSGYNNLLYTGCVMNLGR